MSKKYKQTLRQKHFDREQSWAFPKLCAKYSIAQFALCILRKNPAFWALEIMNGQITWISLNT